MTNSTNTATCLLCHVKLVKNGRNTAGNQRWKCPKCGASSTRIRDDRSRLFTLQRFLDWLLGKHTQADTKPGGTGRTFRHQIRWCWDLRPRITVTGEIHDVIQIDGFNLRTGWCVLVAMSNNKIVAYQWCARESQAAWSALFVRLPEPVVVVCDGSVCDQIFVSRVCTKSEPCERLILSRMCSRGM